MHIPQPELNYPTHIQILDKDFDGAEMDDELKLGMHEAQTALFYHDGFGLEQ